MSKINDKAQYIYLNGKIVKENKALISVKDRGFRFGDGCFETIRINTGNIFQLKVHLERLQTGLNALKIKYDVEELPVIFTKVIEKNRLYNGFLRVSITRGAGSRGYLPDIQSDPTVVVESMGEVSAIEQPVDLWLGSYRKIPQNCLPANAKTMQGLNSSLARMEADANNCFEALLLGEENKICEGSSSNIFWIKNNQLFTPSLESGVLPGVLRSVIIRISPLQVKEGVFYIEDLKDADEVFITNVAWLAVRIKEIKPLGLKFDHSQYFSQIQQLILKDIAGSGKL